MNNRLKTICLVLITLAILIGVGFYCWSVLERQNYFERQEPTKIQSPSEWRDQY